MKTLSTTSEIAKDEEKEVKKPVVSVNSTPKTEEVVKEEIRDRPFSAEYFDVKDWGTLLLEPKLDVDSLQQKIVFVENFLKDQLFKNKMNCDKEAFKSILEDIESNLGVTSNHSLSHRVSRVYGFLSVINATKNKEDFRRKSLMAILKK
jgi:hypothetical protein